MLSQYPRKLMILILWIFRHWYIPNVTPTLDGAPGLESNFYSSAAYSMGNLQCVPWDKGGTSTSSDEVSWNDRDRYPRLAQWYTAFSIRILSIPGTFIYSWRCLQGSDYCPTFLTTEHSYVAALSSSVLFPWLRKQRPGITAVVMSMKNHCNHCNRMAPSQPSASPTPLVYPLYHFNVGILTFSITEVWITLLSLTYILTGLLLRYRLMVRKA